MVVLNDRYSTFMRHLKEDAMESGCLFTEDEESLLALPLERARKTLPNIGKSFTEALANTSPYKGPFESFLLTPVARKLYFIRQLLLLESKYTSTQLSNVESTVEKFKLAQLEIRTQSLHCLPSQLAENITRVMTILTAGLDLSDISGKHGPGAVSMRESRDEKWEFRSYSLSIDRYYPFQHYVYSEQDFTDSDRIARLIAVPKDNDKPRLISSEPTANQFIQQGQMALLYEWFRSHPIIKRCVRLEEQDFNRNFLLENPCNSFATLDLSEASDRISVQLVCALLYKREHVRRRLLCSRSTHTQYKRELIELNTFAPMGSAVCFPVETLVFLSIVLGVLKSIRPRDSFRDLTRGVRVYGDDIIVPIYSADYICDVLLALGMKPNPRKTCKSGLFRESCGLEVYDGIDITIGRNKRFNWDTILPEHYGSIVSLQNELFRHGAYRAASYLKYLAPSIPSGKEFFADWIPSLRGSIFRFNARYQRYEVRYPTITSEKIAWRLPEARLLARLHGDNSEEQRSSHSRAKFVWVPFNFVE